MGKLGKKARKFAKKNLQSVLRQRRKHKAFLFKKKPSSSSRDDHDNLEDQVANLLDHPNGSIDFEDVKDISLDTMFGKDDDFDAFEDVSDSDGYLSEDPSCPHAAESETANTIEGERGISSLSAQNEKIYEDLVVQKKKLERLRKKDPKFSKFLLSHSAIQRSQDEDMQYSDEDEVGNQGMQLLNDNGTADDRVKLFTSSAINSWCELTKEEHSNPALICLLNAYRAACHYGADSSGHQIQNSETFCNILIFVLSEADDIFRKALQISSSSKKETILELKNTSKWKNVKPLVKSFIRSTLFLLNQVADSDILAFALDRLRASVIFFAAFPSLLQRLIKTTVHLWATGAGILSSASFLFIRDVAATFSSDYLDTCIAKTFMAYIAQSRVSEIANIRHMQFLKNSIVELCSLDVQMSSAKALESICQLSRILRWGLQTKKKEALKKICSWEYVNCIDVWVTFVSANAQDYELQPLLIRTVQLINGLACLFTGPRYFPLRLKCIEWLNNLSSSSGIFIPVASYVLDVLECKIVKEGGKPGSVSNFSSVLKLPKSFLKSKAFQEECILSVVEQLSLHFTKWSYHISFPELATIPIIWLRKFYESTTTESLRRTVKRLIDQVEQNVDFVRKKRDEVAFSPKDHQSIESFLQLEKSCNSAPFSQYYRSILEKAALRSLHKNEKLSLHEKKKSKRKRGQLTESIIGASLSSDPAIVNGRVSS